MMKNDYSAESMGILAQKVSHFFASEWPTSRVWMTDIYQWPSYEGNDVVDVVFFGDFFRKFLETGNWTFKNTRLWCLGSPTKNFFERMAGLKTDQISIIPRHFLYPSVHFAPLVPSVRKDSPEFVYAGRLTPTKRILTQLWSIFYLQTRWNVDASFTLFGEFIQEDKFCDCPGANPYREQVMALVNTLAWKKRPRLEGKVQAHEWVNRKFHCPIYYSLSVLPFEDFSVSIAQAQEKGWPCIVNQWGAHKDINGTLLRLPLQLLEGITETEESAQREGAAIADYIANKPFQNIAFQKKPFQVPAITNLNELDDKRRAFLGQWGMSLQDVIRHRTENLKNTPLWNEFMKEYLKSFT